MRIWKKILLVFLFASMPVLMAQVSGPTTRTPRLTVSPGDTNLQNLIVNGTTTFNDDVGISTNQLTVQDLVVSGTCTGCGGQQTTDTIALQFTEGCSNSPDINMSYTLTGNVVTVQFADGADADCTSDGTNFGTLANALPVELETTEDRRVKYTPLSLAGVQTEACVVFHANRSVEFFTGISCATAPGNVAKVVTTTVQNTLTFLLAS